MKCRYCAEEIQDAAILCRFCGAQRYDGTWAPPVTERTKPKGSFTMGAAGVCFILSALFELFAIKSEVPLFGAMRGGTLAFGYHTLFLVVFLCMGIGLLRAAPWGYPAVLVGTGIYALDRFLYFFDDAARSAHTREYRQLGSIVDLPAVGNLLRWEALLYALCWIGFALYVARRREYFQRREVPN